MGKPHLLGLAQELIDGIVDCLSERRQDLLNLCTVDKKLRASAQRQLYRRINLGLFDSNGLALLIRTVIENPELRVLIRELTIRPAGTEPDARMTAVKSYEAWPQSQFNTSEVSDADMALVRGCQMRCRSFAAYNLTTMLGLLFYFLPRLKHLDLHQIDISGPWDGMSNVISHAVEHGPVEYRFLSALKTLRLYGHYDVAAGKAGYSARGSPSSPVYHLLTLADPDVLHLNFEGNGYRVLNLLGKHQMLSARTIIVDDLGQATARLKLRPPYHWEHDKWVGKSSEVTKYRLDSTLTEHCPHLEEFVLQVNGKNIFFGADMVGKRLLNRLPKLQKLKKLHVQMESFFADPLEMNQSGLSFACALPAELEDIFLNATTVSHGWGRALFRNDPTRALYRQGLKNVLTSLSKAHRARRMHFKTVIVVAERVNHADMQRELNRDLWTGTSVRFLMADPKLGALLWEKGVTSGWLEEQRVLVR